MRYNDIVMGSFTYSSKDTYIVGPDGAIFLGPSWDSEKKTHEAYHEEGSERAIRYVLNDGYRKATEAEIYAWAQQVAAKNADITQIIAIKSAAIPRIKSFAFGSIQYQDITVTVYGEPLPGNIEALGAEFRDD
ncbi:hypothetical protein ACYULU_10080 [Breznakiellaceae bacterium SP9]